MKKNASSRTVKAKDFLFSTLHITPFLYDKIQSGIFHLLHANIANVRYPTWFKPTITLGRSNQIASSQICHDLASHSMYAYIK